MKINKNFLQFVAAFLILIFHVWVNISKLGIEQYILRVGYVGVDIFFFLSAYSLADKQIKYLELIKNRFINIYCKFVILVMIAAIYKKMQPIKVVKTLTAVDFFERGGGSFLWFVPAIMLFYLVYPLFVNWKSKYKVIIVAALWFGASLAIYKLTGYNKAFIFTNRIPVILAGYVLKRRDLPKWISLPCLPIGLALLYMFGFKNKLNKPFTDIYFVVGLVFVIGIVAVSGYIKPAKIWKILSIGTLELYGLQMIFGPKLAMSVYKGTKSAILTNLITIVVLYAAAIAFSEGYAWIMRKCKILK